MEEAMKVPRFVVQSETEQKAKEDGLSANADVVKHELQVTHELVVASLASDVQRDNTAPQTDEDCKARVRDLLEKANKTSQNQKKRKKGQKNSEPTTASKKSAPVNAASPESIEDLKNKFNKSKS